MPIKIEYLTESYAVTIINRELLFESYSAMPTKKLFLAKSYAATIFCLIFFFFK